LLLMAHGASTPYVDALRRELSGGAEEAVTDARELEEASPPPWSTATRDHHATTVLSAAWDEITASWPRGSRSVRLRGAKGLVVTLPAAESQRPGRAVRRAPYPGGGRRLDEGGGQRPGRQPEGPPRSRRGREEASEREGLSVNAWPGAGRLGELDAAPPPCNAPDGTGYSPSERAHGAGVRWTLPAHFLTARPARESTARLPPAEMPPRAQEDAQTCLFRTPRPITVAAHVEAGSIASPGDIAPTPWRGAAPQPRGTSTAGRFRADRVTFVNGTLPVKTAKYRKSPAQEGPRGSPPSSDPGSWWTVTGQAGHRC